LSLTEDLGLLELFDNGGLEGFVASGGCGTLTAYAHRVPSPDPCTVVLIVSRNRETAHNLQQYFESRSLNVTVLARFARMPFDSRPTPTALVVFPDEFPKDEAEMGLLEFAQHYPSATMTVVTADTQRFEDLATKLGETALRRLLVLPRPAFSWTILDHVITPITAEDSTRGF
jgi:hypothetical protein